MEHDIQLEQFLADILKGKAPQAVLISPIDFLGQYPVYTSYKSMFEAMTSANDPMYYVYGMSGILQCIAFNIDGKQYRMLLVSVPEDSSVSTDKVIVSVTSAGGVNIGKDNSIFKHLNSQAIVRLMHKHSHIDEEFYKRNTAKNVFDLGQYKLVGGTKEIPCREISKDTNRMEEEIILRDMLDDGKDSIVAYYKNGKFDHVRFRMHKICDDSRGMRTVVYYPKVYLEALTGGAKTLRADCDLYGDDIKRTVQYDLLLVILDKLWHSPLPTASIQAPPQSAPQVKGFGK